MAGRSLVAAAGHEVRDWISVTVASAVALEQLAWRSRFWNRVRRRDERGGRWPTSGRPAPSASEVGEEVVKVKHEDGYCDKCGAQLVDVAWLTFDGHMYCESCGRGEMYQPARKDVDRDNER